MNRLFLFGVLTLVAGGGISPVDLSGQAWELQAGWVRIDHDYASRVVPYGEQIPDGVGLSVRRSLRNSNFFLELELSRGSQRRTGAICGGFIQPGDCISERVHYTGGISMFSLAWLGEKRVGGSWSFGLRPEFGLGLLRAHESGSETSRSFSDWQTAISVGLGAEVGVQVPGRERVRVFGAATWNHLRPVLVIGCDDCRMIYRDPLPQTSLSFGVRWSHPSKVGSSR